MSIYEFLYNFNSIIKEDERKKLVEKFFKEDEDFLGYEWFMDCLMCQEEFDVRLNNKIYILYFDLHRSLCIKEEI